MSTAMTTYAEYRQIGDASLGLNDDTTRGRPSRDKSPECFRCEEGTTQGSATVVDGFRPVHAPVCEALYIPIEALNPLRPWTINSFFREDGVSPALRSPDREIDLIVPLVPKSARPGVGRIRARVRATPKPMLHSDED